MEIFENFLLYSYWGGLIWIAFGIWMIRFTIKNPQEKPYSMLQGDMKGWAAGVVGIALGICIIIAKLLGKL